MGFFKPHLNAIRSKLSRLSQSSTVQGFVWLLSAKFLKIFLQAFYFIFLARALHPEHYGMFVAITALVNLTLPFASWGSSQLLVKNVSRNKSLIREYWGNSLFISSCGGIAILLVIVLLQPIVLSKVNMPAAIALIAVSDLVLGRFTDVSFKALACFDKLDLAAHISTVQTGARVLAAAWLNFLVVSPSILNWSVLYFISGIVPAVFSTVLLYRIFGSPTLKLSLMKPEAREGFYFAVDMSARTVCNDLDKTMLAQLSTLNATGLYGLGYRVIGVATSPILTILTISYSKFFEQGEAGIRGSLKVARRFAPIAIAYSAAMSLLICLFAPAIPKILGPEYEAAIGVIRWLSPVVVLSTIQFFSADTLTGAGLQGARTALQVSIGLLNGILNFWLIPLYSWRGAVWSTLISEGLLVIILFCLIGFFYRRQQQDSQPI